MYFCIEGREDVEFHRVLRGREWPSGEESEDRELAPPFEEEEMFIVKYESSWIKARILPHKPRLFCILIDGKMVEYEKEDEESLSEEGEQE